MENQFHCSEAIKCHVMLNVLNDIFDEIKCSIWG